jgi:hypothetical protein
LRVYSESLQQVKTRSESFDCAQDERTEFDTIDDFPFMLSFSKHSGLFSRLLN